ncbi:MAG: alpha/beta hydrolase [Trueperaceae bacterium]|nr:alpha/beta hydrolase [Trueperaceae bacterium]
MTWIVGIVAFIVVVGSIYQALGARADASAYPAPGVVLDVGGHSLHIHCTGTAGEGHPTVILEALSGGTSANWGRIQPQLAEVTRVCSYDRAGRAWSQDGIESRDLWGSVSDLEGLLRAAGEPGPYVMVGHSLGGHYVRGFAQVNPDSVLGVVLLDSSHPDQLDRYPAYEQDAKSFLHIARFFPAVARVGLFRLFFATGGEIDFQELPERQHAELASFWSTADFHRSVVSEMRLATTINRQAQMVPNLGDTPLLVISAGTNTPVGWDELQRDLATHSTDSRHVTIPNADHVSLTFNEADAAQVSELIAGFVAEFAAR